MSCMAGIYELLLHAYQAAILCTIFHSVSDTCRPQEWRPYRLLLDGQASGIRLSNLMKMRLAVSHHFKGEGSQPDEAAEFLDRIFSHLKKIWGYEAASKPEAAANPAEAVV